MRHTRTSTTQSSGTPLAVVVRVTLGSLRSNTVHGLAAVRGGRAERSSAPAAVIEKVSWGEVPGCPRDALRAPRLPKPWPVLEAPAK